MLNHDTAIASAAARMVTAAAGRPIIEMGGRRTHEQAAIATARAAYLAGFASTSNLAAGRRYGIPTVGTAAHAFTLAHESEEAAFRSQVEAQGPGTTLLVDTYDIAEGIRTAVRVAGPALGAVRIDSGDLADEATKARALLDELGATGTRVVATSDLDEFVITALADAPIDGYGVGTRVATGSGHPTASMVYKLVAVGDQAAATRHSGRSRRSRRTRCRSAATRPPGGSTTTPACSSARASPCPARLSPPAPDRVQVPGDAGSGVDDPRTRHRGDPRPFTAAGAAPTLPTEALSVAAGAPYLTVTPSRRRQHDRLSDQGPDRSSTCRTTSSRAAPSASPAAVTSPTRISEHLAAHADDYAVIAASRDWHHGHGDQQRPLRTRRARSRTSPRPGRSTACRTGRVGLRARAGHRRRSPTTSARARACRRTPRSRASPTTARRSPTCCATAGVTDVEITGIATDYCVRATALDARREGFAVRVLDGLHAGVAPETQRGGAGGDGGQERSQVTS